MRLVFMGSPQFSVPVLTGLVAAGHEIACVYTKAPQKSGRGMALRPGPVQLCADSLGLAVRHPAHWRDQTELDGLASLQVDLAIVVAYGLILPEAVLAAPKIACLNLHASLLPRWRGAAPIQRAIAAGDTQTGIDLMIMEAGLDTGPVLARRTTPILADDTSGSLTERLSHMGRDLVVDFLAHRPAEADSAAQRANFLARARPQRLDGVTYARKITSEEARIDWQLDASSLERQIRAFSPSPGSYFFVTDPLSGARIRVKIIHARVEAIGSHGSVRPGEILDERFLVACGPEGDGTKTAIRLLHMQREGRQAAKAADFLRAVPLAVGSLLD